MINRALYKREMKSSMKLLLIFAAIITLYVSVIISMYEPKLAKLLDGYVELMPQLMSAVGMKAGATSLLGFMCSYLYGFILLFFPMLFCILRGNGLISRYVEKQSIVSLMAAPVKRRTIVVTQMVVLVGGILILDVYSTILEIGCAEHFFPGELAIEKLLILNAGLLCLHLFIGGICFLASCACADTKYSIGFGAGIPVLMYVLQMLANVGGKAEKAKYFTFFTLFCPEGMIAVESNAIMGTVVLFVLGMALFILGVSVFCKKDLHI